MNKMSHLVAALAATTLVAALATGVMAETVNTVTVTKFNQSYPYTGKATVEYTVGGTLSANAVAEITLSADGVRATFTQRGVVAGANRNVVDFASSFGGALLLTNASFVVTITEDLGGVQLWENGPYWAECNVGAARPEDYGYQFWWGDTVGYTHNGSGWFSTKNKNEPELWFSHQDSRAGSTYDKDNSALRSAGWIDSTGNLTATHDAATAHLGAPWRMPTRGDIDALIGNCTTTWITTNGVQGRLVTGKDDYAGRSIFLPAAGIGYYNESSFPGSGGYYWSSTPHTNDYGDEDPFSAERLEFGSSSFERYTELRSYGHSVRPVRGFSGVVSAPGTVTYDPAVFVIESVADWNELSAIVAGGIPADEGLNVRLANDIGPVSTMVGTAAHPFSGVFDGGSNTLTLALSGSDYHVAPFSGISGATIRDLKVAGTVSGGMHCSGLVGAIVGDATNLIEGCEVAAAISSTRTHFGGFVGHSYTSAATLRGCVFSGSLSGGIYVAIFNGWSDAGAATTLIDCLDASECHAAIGRGANAVCVTNTYWLAARYYNNIERVWSDGKRGKEARSVTADEDVELGCGEPLRTYGASGLAAYPVGVAYGGKFYAASGASVTLSLAFTGTPPAGKKHVAFAASAGELAKNGDDWVLTMPAGNVVVSATFATAYEIWAAANGISGAWDETDDLGIHNVFRYAFDKPTGAFEDPVLLSISFDASGNSVIHTPPLNPSATDFDISILATPTLIGTPDGEGVSTYPLDPSGSTTIPTTSPARFFRLRVVEK